MSVECFASGSMIVISRCTPDPAGGRADRDEIARLAISGAQSVLRELLLAIENAEQHQADINDQARLARLAEIEKLEGRLADLRAVEAEHLRRSIPEPVRFS